MSIVLSIQNKQYIVAEKQKFSVDRIDKEVGSKIECEVIGSMSPSKYNSRSKVELEIVKHYKGKKKIYFRKTPRNGDRKTKGYRHSHTMLVWNGAS